MGNFSSQVATPSPLSSPRPSQSTPCREDAATKRKFNGQQTIEEQHRAKNARVQNLQFAKERSLQAVFNREGVVMDKHFWEQHPISQDEFQQDELWEQLITATVLCENESQNEVSAITGFNRRTLVKYSGIFKQCGSEVDAARFSNQEREKKQEEAFKFHVEQTFKPGPRTGGLDPNVILEARRLNDEFVDLGDGGSISTQRLAESNCIIPAIMSKRAEENMNTLVRPKPFSQTVLTRLMQLVCPVKKPLTKTANGHEEDCRVNALGAFTEVALLPVALEGVHPSLIISQDSCSMYLGDDVPDHCWITADMADAVLRANRAIKTDGAVQRRTYRLHAGIAPGMAPMVFVQGIICDREITQIISFEIMNRVRIVFSPYSAESEQNAVDPGDENTELFVTFEKSLARRVAGHIIEKCVEDSQSYRQSLRDDAQRMLGSSYNPETYRKLQFLFDGESGPLTEVLETYGEEYESESMSWFKHSTKHSKTVQPNDLAPGMHPGWKRAVRSDEFLKFDSEQVKKQIMMYPGMKPALDFLQKQRMSPASKHMFEKAIAYTPFLLSKHITVNVVQKAFSDAKIHPLNEAEMFATMYSPFSKLSQLEALECLRIAQGPLREIGGSRFPRGIIWASEVQRCVAESDIINGIVNVSTTTNLDEATLNRQGAIWLTREIRELHVERRDTALFQVALVQLDAQDKKRKEMEGTARLKHCVRSHDFNQSTMTMTYTCRCGGTWVDGFKGFLAHEKLKQHSRYFQTCNWADVYERSNAEDVNAVAAAPLDPQRLQLDDVVLAAVPRRARGGRGRAAAAAAPVPVSDSAAPAPANAAARPIVGHGLVLDGLEGFEAIVELRAQQQ
jgi:hypothetical protein